MKYVLATASLTAVLLAACGGSDPDPDPAPKVPAATASATPRATCGPGSNPETGLQGRVAQADYDAVVAAGGYRCNAEMVGRYPEAGDEAVGTIGGFKVERYVDAAGHECAYYDSTLMYPTNIFDTTTSGSGVIVLDMSDPAHPVRTAQLQTPAMLTPHESLALNQARGLLVAVTGNALFYPGWLDVYDVSQDCRNPGLPKASLPIGVIGHESGFAPDGMTYYSASPGTPTLTAIDLTDPSAPVPFAVAQIKSHGLMISDDGNRAYVAAGSSANENGLRGDTGLIILDTTEVQEHRPNAVMREISRLSWDTLSIPQNAIPVTIGGKPYVVEIDEFGAQKQVGAGRIIDISEETAPKVVSDLRLEVHQPENFAAQANDPGAGNFVGGYAGHYCNVPTRIEPKIVACSMILSGLRVFDIRDPAHPREVAYFNRPAPRGTAAVFDGAWAMSSPAFVPERKEIWYTDGNSGFYVVRITNGAWPD
jgi:hypothetical protein